MSFEVKKSVITFLKKYIKVEKEEKISISKIV